MEHIERESGAQIGYQFCTYMDNASYRSNEWAMNEEKYVLSTYQKSH